MTKNTRFAVLQPVPILLFAILVIGVLFMFSMQIEEYKQIESERYEYLENVLNDVDIGFSPFFQLVDTIDVFSGELPLTPEAHELFLTKLFSTSRSEFLYGAGMWYEPGMFEEGKTWYGPYVRYNDLDDDSYSVTYEWSTPEYDYQNTYWYQLIFFSEGDDVVITAPYFDTDYTYITIGKPFFRDGIKSGVFSVDIILPIFEGFFSKFDFSSYEGVYLTTADNDLIYELKGVVGSGTEFFHDNKFYNLNVDKWYAKNDKSIIPITIESRDNLLRIYGYIDRTGILKELFSRYGARFGIFLIGWLILFTAFFLYNRMHRQTAENIELKDEIERRIEAERQLEFLAYHDNVTALPNINAFFENVDQPVNGRDSRNLIIFSLDNIRELSLLLERGLIDSLLRDFAGKLKAYCPDDSMQFRGRGFTFYIVNSDLHPGESRKLAENLQKEFSKTIPLHNKHVRLRIKIGMVSFRDAQSLENLLSMSESTLTDSESSKINRVSHYNSEIEGRKSFLVALDAEMSNSNFIDELRMVYQPVIRVNDRRIAGVEALVRWDSTFFKTTISPGEFIPLAEENGYIIDLGWFVIREVYKLLSGPFRENDWFVSVNVSPLQFIESDFPKKLDKLTKTYGIDKSRLKLEITESSAASSVQFFWTAVEQLIKMGFRLALDDFGTGESSFSRLYSYRFDTLKIDRSLIQDIIDNQRNQQIFKSILRLGEVMDNNVIAEGIETEEEHELLKSFGLTYAQGFLYSKPVNLEDLPGV